MRAERIAALLGALIASVACGGREVRRPDGAADDAERLDAVADAARPDGEELADVGAPDDAPPPDATIRGWQPGPAADAPLQEIAAELLDDRIWLAGGFETPTRILDRVRILDPRTGRWSDGPALPAPRHHLVLVAHGGDLYALGGMRDLSFEPLESAWVLRAGASSWTPIAPLPEPRAAGTGASLAGHVLYAGGLTRGGRVAADVLRYDPATDRWTRGAPMPTPREHLGGAVFDGELWTIAGRLGTLTTNHDTVEIYDPEADRWRTGPSLGLRRGGCAAAAAPWAGLVVVAGGEQPDRALTEVEWIRPGEPGARWTRAPDLGTARHGFALVAAAGRLWAIGGADRPLFAALASVETLEP